jgi:hypothetical protein
MSRLSIGSAVLSLALAGCVVNGKKLFDLPGGSSSSSSSGESTSSDGGLPASVAALPEAKAPASYAWCAKAPDVNGDLDRALSDDFDFGLPSIVGSLCNPRTNEEKDARGRIEARRLAWLKQLGMNEADWASDVIEWSNIDFGHRNSPRVEPRGGAWSKLSPIGQFALMQSHGAPGEQIFLADALPLTEAGRLAYVINCVHTPFAEDTRPGAWAICLPDIDSLDVGKLGGELRVSKEATAYERMTVRRNLAILLFGELPDFRMKLKRLTDSDPAYQTMFDTAKKYRAGWEKAAKAPERAALLALVSSMEDARVTGSKKALAGCEAKTWNAFADYVRSMDRKDFAKVPTEGRYAAVRAVTGDINGFLAATALALCDATGPGLFLAPEVADGILRGPRTTTVFLLEMAESQKEFELDTGGVASIGLDHPRSLAPFPSASPMSEDRRSGTVSKVTTAGENVGIEFTKSKVHDDSCAQWRETDRIDGVTASGKIVYRSECVKRNDKDYMVGLDPITMPSATTGGIEKGVEIVIESGLVVAITKDGVTRNVFGIELK